MTSTGASAMITYSKLRDGSWGLRAEGEDSLRTLRQALAGGGDGLVEVHTRGGQVRKGVHGRMLWRVNGAGGMVAVATIVTRNTGPQRLPRPLSADDVDCPTCGEYEAWEVGCNDPWHDEHCPLPVIWGFWPGAS